MYTKQNHNSKTALLLPQKRCFVRKNVKNYIFPHETV